MLRTQGREPTKPFLLQMCSPCSCASTCLSQVLDNPQKAETLPLLSFPGSSGLKQAPPQSLDYGVSLGTLASFIVSVPCASLPQAGPYPKQLGMVRVDTIFAQHRPPPHSCS